MYILIRNTLMSLLLFTILTGIIYPLVVTGIAQVIFPEQANGSIIVKNGKAVGSGLIGQQFDDPKYFWGRLSATGPVSLQRRCVVRFQSRAEQPESHGCRRRAHQSPA